MMNILIQSRIPRKKFFFQTFLAVERKDPFSYILTLMKIVEFPLVTSHLAFAYEQWKVIIRPGCCLIDATCGNGKDTLRLAQLIDQMGSVLALDIQGEAIEHTERLLSEQLSEQRRKQVHLFHQSHETFPKIAYQKPVQLIVYNLGYLPGGNKELTTLTKATLNSLNAAMSLLSPGGLICMTCYPGHEEGKKEQQALLSHLKGTSSNEWNIAFYRKMGSETAPSILLIKKEF